MALGADDIFLIDDLETLRLLTQPLRLRLLETLRTALEPMSVKELAADLGTPQTRLYHHVNLLEEHGLIRVARTRVVSGITEKRYEATAARVGVDRSLLGRRGEGADASETLDVLLSVILDEVRGEIRRAVQAGLIDLELSHEDRIGPRRLVFGRKWYRFTAEELDAFQQRLFAVANPEVADPFAPVGDDQGQLYELLIGFYPALPPIRRDADLDDAEAPSESE